MSFKHKGFFLEKEIERQCRSAYIYISNQHPTWAQGKLYFILNTSGGAVYVLFTALCLSLEGRRKDSLEKKYCPTE